MDFTGRMTSLTDIDGSVFAYEFDGEGTRLSQSLNDCLSKRFVYDGADVLLELNPTNGVAYAWVNGPGIDQPIERLLFIDGSPRARRVFHADALGSVAALTDPSGLVTQTYAYSAFGSLRSFVGHDLNRVTYTGREQLGDSQGLMYYRYRVYVPQLGRFLSSDPLGFSDGNNTWIYLHNAALLYSDSFGLSTEWFPSGPDIPLGTVFMWRIEPGTFDSALDIIGKVWTLPNTALGLVGGGISCICGGTVDIGHNAIQFHTPFFDDKGAMTLGNVTLYFKGWDPSTPWRGYDDSFPYDVDVGFHEEAHTYQYQLLGPLFLPTYLPMGIASGNNPLEKAADDYARQKGCQ